MRTVQRRCVICRRSGEKSGLLRFVAEGTSLVWDELQRKPGRGAYVHRTPACWSKMSQAGPFEHALRLGKSALSLESVREAARESRSAVPELGPGQETAERPAVRRNGRKVRL